VTRVQKEEEVKRQFLLNDEIEKLKRQLEETKKHYMMQSEEQLHKLEVEYLARLERERAQYAQSLEQQRQEMLHQ
jgi:hypothetical protein